MEWTNEVALKFLELYETETIIWDPAHREHKCRSKVYDAWQRIVTEMGEGYTTDSLKKKKESLFASYRLYARRVRDSKRSGNGLADVYTPTWFAYRIMNRFLSCKDKPQNTFDSETIGSDGSYIDNPANGLRESDNHETDGGEGSQFQSSVPPENEGVVLPAPCGTTKLHKRFMGKRKIVSPETHDRKQKFDTAFSTIEKNAARSEQNKESDICDLYGELLAAKLKKLSDNDRELCMHRIDNVVFEITYSHNIPPVPATSPYAHQRSLLTSHLTIDPWYNSSG